LSKILIGELGITTGMFLARDFQLRGSTLKSKILIPGKIVEVRVKGGSNFM